MGATFSAGLKLWIDPQRTKNQSLHVDICKDEDIYKKCRTATKPSKSFFKMQKRA